MTTQYDRVLFHGKQVTRRQRAALREVEKDLGREFIVWQGSWRPMTDYSGSTHTGSGVVDLGLPGMGDNDETRAVTRRLRRVGKQAAFLRGPEPFGGFSWHWHVVDLDPWGEAASAVWQAQQYQAGLEGISSTQNGPDPVPYRPDPIERFDYIKWQKAQTLKARIKEMTHELNALRKRRREARQRLESLEQH